MRRMHPRNWFFSVWGLIFVMAVCLLARCLSISGLQTGSGGTSFSFSVRTAIAVQAVRTFLPGLTNSAGTRTLFTQSSETSPYSALAALCTLQWEPVAFYAVNWQTGELADADADTAAADEATETPVTEAPVTETPVTETPVTETPAADAQETQNTDSAADTATGALLVETSAGTILQHGAAAELAYTEAQLFDFTFLLNNLYTLDSTTTIDASLLDGATLLAADMTLAKDASVPQILIYHTHSQETFADSVAGDVSTSIVGVGDYLTTLLTDVYGYQVIHDRQTYDLIDGELDRNKAYTLALDDVSEILEENPTVQIVIDLHRDGIEGEKMTTTINGKETAKLMFFNGLSRTVKNGTLESLANPYIQDNLAFSLQLKLAVERYYPDATRPIYLKGYRYNLHLRPRCLLVEAGSQKNTLQEELNAMEVLADALDMVLRGEE